MVMYNIIFSNFCTVLESYVDFIEANTIFFFKMSNNNCYLMSLCECKMVFSKTLAYEREGVIHCTAGNFCIFPIHITPGDSPF